MNQIKFRKRIVAFVALLALGAFVATMVLPLLSVFAESPSASKTREQITSQSKVKDGLKKKIDDSETKKQDEIDKEKKIETEISSLESEVKQAQAELDQIRTELKQKESELDEIKKKEAAEREKFKERIRVMYESDNLTYVEMLFSSEDLSDAIRKLDAMEEISKYDTKLLDSMDEIEKEVKAAKDKIAEAKSKQEQLKNKLNNKLAELEAKKKERQRIIDGLKADIEEYKKEYDKAERAQQELKRQLANLLSYAASGSKKASAGGFIWPAPSCRGISSQYGYRTHPILGTKLFHSGIDIPAQYGDRVIASKDGKVVFSGTNGGYGNCIILDHGNGQATLYGHMSARLVSVGQKVIKGQQIGRVGSTGRSTGAHLHFEIMINGKHTNPLNYL